MSALVIEGNEILFFYEAILSGTTKGFFSFSSLKKA